MRCWTSPVESVFLPAGSASKCMDLVSTPGFGAPVSESGWKLAPTARLLTWRSAHRAIKENKNKTPQHNTTGESGQGGVGQQSFSV